MATLWCLPIMLSSKLLLPRLAIVVIGESAGRVGPVDSAVVDVVVGVTSRLGLMVTRV